MKPQDLIPAINETRQRVGLAPIGRDAAQTEAAHVELPIPFSTFYHRHPDSFSSEKTGRWHISQRDVNGMKELGAVIEVRTRPDQPKPSLKVVESKMLRWCAGERVHIDTTA